MGAKIQAFDIFQIPLISHYPLPLNVIKFHLLSGIVVFHSNSKTSANYYIKLLQNKHKKVRKLYCSFDSEQKKG
jgi:hypothetical protein